MFSDSDSDCLDMGILMLQKRSICSKNEQVFLIVFFALTVCKDRGGEGEGTRPLHPRRLSSSITQVRSTRGVYPGNFGVQKMDPIGMIDMAANQLLPWRSFTGPKAKFSSV